MTGRLEGLSVIDLTTGVAGPVTTMLLADYGAEVIRVSAPGDQPAAPTPGDIVWHRGKKSVELDLASASGLRSLRALVASADILVETFAPGAATAVGMDDASLRAANPGLIHCSITGYGRRGAASGRPAVDALVQARSGMQDEQPGWRDGPIFLHCPLPSLGAALNASVAVGAALHVRQVTGLGQWVQTSLMQGTLLWMTQIWKRAETPTPELENLWKFKALGPTPCFEAGDHQWFHPMPAGVPVALTHVGRDPGEIPPTGLASGDLNERRRYFDSVAELYRQRPRDEWVELLQRHDVPCQPVRPAETALDHPQLVHNRSVFDIDVPGVGRVRQFGRAYHLELDTETTPAPPPARGAHTDEVLARLGSPAPPPARGAHTDEVLARLGSPAPRPGPEPPTAPTGRPLRNPLEGITVLDFGTAIVGPFATMILSDLGAEVIKVGPTAGAGSAGDAVWVAVQRGKQSLAIDLKTPEGQQIVQRLIGSADVIHYNLRTDVAERLGFGLEQARVINPAIIFCHLTGYGNTGPLARWPGVDQMGQALCGLDHEQGGTADGGAPTWIRFGMCDAAAGMLSVLGVLQALWHRDRTGEGQAVEANILSAALFLASDAIAGPGRLPTRPHLDRAQTGLDPLYRLYQAADGWLCVAAGTDDHWRGLCTALDRADLAGDPRFVDRHARDRNALALAAALEAEFRGRPVSACFDRLDGHGVPCEVATGTTGTDWYDDPDAVANGWVVAYDHPVWGRLEQPGRFFDFSLTPSRVLGPPPLVGQHTREILDRLGYADGAAADLRAAGVVAW